MRCFQIIASVVFCDLVLASAQGLASETRFQVRFQEHGIASLRPASGATNTEFIATNQVLGDVFLRYRRPGQPWIAVNTSSNTGPASTATAPNGRSHEVVCQAVGEAPLTVRSAFVVEADTLLWTVTLSNRADGPVEIGDLAFPLPMNSSFRRARAANSSVLKHSFISGHGSFLFWMRPDSAPPFLVLTPAEDASLEYWDTGSGVLRVYAHSAAAQDEARNHGSTWRIPQTSVVLAPAGRPGAARTWRFNFQFTQDYAGVRDLLASEGKLDVHVVPGMTLPSDLFARLAIRSADPVHAVEPEFPRSTKIRRLPDSGAYRIYEIRFTRLGENRMRVVHGNGRQTFLEFFATEPVETLIRKRAAFIARCQHRDPAKWYNGLISEWNMESRVLLGPDNYDRIKGWRIYAVTCDDPGLSKPAFLAAKNAEYPVQAEVEALDYYLRHFVWGGLQRTTDESHSYGIYGIPDWKTNRESKDAGRNGQLHIWRVYDYPHVILLYHSLYRVAKHNPHIRTALTAREYLERAAGTGLAMFTIPLQVEGWSAYHTGFYNELVIPELIADLEAEGLKDQAGRLRGHWENKVRHFVTGNPDLFGSEYPFDSTGFESTHALARYALTTPLQPRQDGGLVPPEAARRFMDRQMAANIFCRGWVEPAYYYLGSDYRASAGNAYTLSYMAPMGGWAVLDYALNFTTNPAPYLRLGYASVLSSLALINTGTPKSNFGFWYPGKENDGAAGGGFEPAPFGQTWLGQPHHRGSWYYACESDLGYCGTLRAAATVVADDPTFGRFCFGGKLDQTRAGWAVAPRDGVRRRFHALLSGFKLHLVLARDRFSARQPIVLNPERASVSFEIESDNPAPHSTLLQVAGLPEGRYTLRSSKSKPQHLFMKSGVGMLELPVEKGRASFQLERER